MWRPCLIFLRIKDQPNFFWPIVIMSINSVSFRATVLIENANLEVVNYLKRPSSNLISVSTLKCACLQFRAVSLFTVCQFVNLLLLTINLDLTDNRDLFYRTDFHRGGVIFLAIYSETPMITKLEKKDGIPNTATLCFSIQCACLFSMRMLLWFFFLTLVYSSWF